MKTILTLFFSFLIALSSYSQFNHPKMDWWKEVKFGMFIHWGVYTVPAGTHNGKQIGGNGEWIMNSGKIPVEEYKAYAQQFNPVKYNPEAWVKLAKDAGMKYIVITSKHHDGFALFDSKVTNWGIAATPYGKDLLTPLVEACRKEGIKLGFYYSQAQDWNHPGGAASGGHWDVAQEGSMDCYIDNIALPQVKEILENYGDLDILWWDTPVNMTKERSEIFSSLINNYPNLITNNRLGRGYRGDIETPEQFVPATGFPDRNWEVCMTMNDTWGYKSYDNNWKSTQILLQTLVEIVSKGGNFLLNVGPTAEGIIPEPSIKRLKEIGEWIKINSESIYGTTASPFHYLQWGRCTQKDNKLFLHVFNWPSDGQLTVPLLNKVEKAYLLADPKTTLKIENFVSKNIIKLPTIPPDKNISVIVLELIGKPKVLPIPSAGKKVKTSSEKPGSEVYNLTDGNYKNNWQPKNNKKEMWAEVDLGERTQIGAVSVVEPWRIGKDKGQKLKLQYYTGMKWKIISEFTTNGTGHIENIKPITARKFRLKIIESKEPLLNEWILYRAE